MKKQQKENYVLIILGTLTVLMALLVIQVHQLFQLERIEYIMERKEQVSHTKNAHSAGKFKKQIGKRGGDLEQIKLGGGLAYHAQQEAVMEVVDIAIRSFTQNKNVTLQEINNSEGVYIIDDIYAFVIEGNVIIAHPFRKDLINADMSDREDIRGHKYGRELIGATTRGGWIDYHFNIPDQSAIAQKHTYCRRIQNNEEYVICAGYYEE